MPYYDYRCLDCWDEATAIKGSPLTEEEELEAMFETRHAMVPEPADLAVATECPRCAGHNTVKVLNHNNIHTYTRGYGYLDRAGCHRDMNVHKLVTDDPYAHMREAGEADDLKVRLQRGGQRPKDTKHYFPNPTSDTEMTQAVKSSVLAGGQESQ